MGVCCVCVCVGVSVCLCVGVSVCLCVCVCVCGVLSVWGVGLLLSVVRGSALSACREWDLWLRLLKGVIWLATGAVDFL